MASYVPSSTKTLAATGGIGFGTWSLTQSIWLIAGVLVVGGVLLGFSKLGPRLAFEPVALADGRRRWRLTRNGQPLFRRH